MQANIDSGEFSPRRIAIWENRINQYLLTQVTGSIYDSVAREQDGPTFNDDWNTIRVKLDEQASGDSREIEVFVNDELVSSRDVDDSNAGLGNIGFQAHRGGKQVVFKNIEWRELPE